MSFLRIFSGVVLPLDLGSRVGIGDEMIERRHQAINEAFPVTLTQVLVATPRMTAAEALLRSQEKAAPLRRFGHAQHIALL